MTCIVGLVHDEKIYMGADSAGASSWFLHRRADKKIFTRQNFIVGFTTSYRMGQLLTHSLVFPKRNPGKDALTYMVTDFVDSVRECLKKGGYAKRKEEVEEGGTFMVGYEGKLFSVYDDYSVAMNQVEYMAIGSGQYLAMGSLFSTEGMEPTRRLETALRAAQEFNPFVREPFYITSLPQT